MKLSLIVPIYNCETYLLEFLSSLKVALGDFLVDIIFVLEPCQDNSKSLLLDNLRYFKDAKVIENKEKLGPLNSRLAGVKQARGEYICFVDSDDYLFPNYFESILSSLKEDSDLIIFGYEILNKRIHKYRQKEKIITQEKAKKSLLLDIKIRSFLWNKVFKKSLFMKIDFSMLPSVDIYEDLALVYSYLDFCNKIKLSKEIIYRYLMHEDSLTGNSLNRVVSRMRVYAYVYKKNIENKVPHLNKIFSRYSILFKSYIIYDSRKEKLTRKETKKFLLEFKNMKRS